MGFKHLSIKKSYSSEEDDVLFDFYLPVLENSYKYDRIAGFFSSTSLAIASKGIFNLIKNGGVMRLITCPRLRPEDLEVIKKTDFSKDSITDVLNRDLDTINEDFAKDHLKALGWLLKNNRLIIKIALIFDDNGNLLDHEQISKKGIFHQKIGILYDLNEDIISFSGSINESASAWLENIEEFKVFKSWDEYQIDYLRPDIEKFERIWDGNSKRIKILPTPEAIINNLISIAPDDINTINWKKYYKQKTRKIVSKEESKLFEHQKQAVIDWVENGKKGLFVMATGTGKTYTSLGCLDLIANDEKSWICIIACPQNHLAQQWKSEVDKYGIDYEILITADSTNSGWQDEIISTLIDIELGYRRNAIIITTHKTLASARFIKALQEHKKNNKYMLIADEVHGLGSKSFRKGLLDEYDLRIGLSATPQRWFDEVGTDYIYNYFNGVVFEFGLERALSTINPATGKTYLTPYKYMPLFVKMGLDELEDYINTTLKIVRLTSGKKKEENELIENLLFARANLIKNVGEKYEVLGKVLDSLKGNIKSTLCFCSPQQIEDVMLILQRKSIIAHRFTEKEGTKSEAKYGGISQRKYLLDRFTTGVYQVLVAIKCLDEGVDVPNAEKAIIMASSSNSREYIQRIGRVIRRSPGKERAIIFDMIVIPSLDKLPPEIKKYERKIFEKELIRATEIASFAINNAEALDLLSKVK